MNGGLQPIERGPFRHDGLLHFGLIDVFESLGVTIIYALQDIDFDSSKNLRSIPVLLGKKKALYLSIVFHLITSATLLYAGSYGNLGLFYWLGCALFIGLLAYQSLIINIFFLERMLKHG